MTSRRAKRRNISLYNNYVSSSIGMSNNNGDIQTPRTKHIYFDSREDVRIRGKKQTMEKGTFQATLVNSLKNVKRITIHQITMPGTMHNVINRRVNITLRGTITKQLIFTELSLDYQNLDDFATQLTQQFKIFAQGISNPITSNFPTFNISHTDTDSITITSTHSSIPGYSWEIDFNPDLLPSNNMGPFFGIEPEQRLAGGPNNNQTNRILYLTGESIPDINGFNYMYIRCPELNLNSEFNLTEIDIHKKNNILGRVPVNYSENVMSFDSSWFYPHETDINIVKNITFQFYYYNGSSPNFHNENISLVLIFEYID